MRLIACLLMLLAASGCQAQPPFGKIEPFTGRLELPDGATCSGTRDGYAITTSRHCMEGPSRQVRFQGILVNVTHVWIDGENIHVYTDRYWGRGPVIGPMPKKGDPLYIIGNAGGFEQIARVANLAGTSDRTLPKVTVLLIACAACWHGDSGAGVFNAKGELVAVFLGAYNFVTREPSGTPSVFSLQIAVPVR